MKEFFENLANRYVREDAEMQCGIVSSDDVFSFERDSDTENYRLVSKNLVIPFHHVAPHNVAADFLDVALAIDPDEFVMRKVNEGKSEENTRMFGGLSSLYNSAIDRSAMVLGIGAAVALSEEREFDLGGLYIDHNFSGMNRFSYKDDGVLQIVLPFPRKVRRNLQGDFAVAISRKTEEDSAPVAIFRYLVGAGKDERILKQLARDNKGAPIPLLLAARKVVTAYLSSIATALGVPEKMRPTV